MAESLRRHGDEASSRKEVPAWPSYPGEPGATLQDVGVGVGGVDARGSTGSGGYQEQFGMFVKLL